MRARACRRCRQKKLKCNEERPCDACKLSSADCQPQHEPVHSQRIATLAPRQDDQTAAVLQEISAIDLSQKVLSDEPTCVLTGQSTDNSGFTQMLGRDLNAEYSSSAIPGGNSDRRADVQTDWRLFFPYFVPSVDILDIVFDQYFTLVNWFMLVIDEKSFRKKAAKIFERTVVPDDCFNFCMLMSTAWGLGAHYLRRSTYNLVDADVLEHLSQSAFQHLEQVYLRVISHPNLEAVQIGILYGSYNLFNGAPNLGFGVLGSTVKIAQVIGLHRESLVKRTDNLDYEPCRRVWWALEIFDKYAAIAFGRPATIDDSDCDVKVIDDSQDLIADIASDTTSVTFATYHRYKILLYRIMGSFLSRKKQMYRSTSISEIRARLAETYAGVPESLKCKEIPNMMGDCLLVIQMQAIALALAYNNLQLVLHRHLLFAAQRKVLAPKENEAVLAQLMDSALQTANLVRHPVTRNLYVATHAAMHLGLCALSAGIVLCAILLDQQTFERRDSALSAVRQITDFFSTYFVGRSYRLAEQAAQILNALSQKIDGVSDSLSDRNEGMKISLGHIDLPEIGLDHMNNLTNQIHYQYG